MEFSTEPIELKALSAPAILGADENTKPLSFPRHTVDSPFEPVGIVAARIVDKLMASPQMDAA